VGSAPDRRHTQAAEAAAESRLSGRWPLPGGDGARRPRLAGSGRTPRRPRRGREGGDSRASGRRRATRAPSHRLSPVGSLNLKGFARPIVTYEVVRAPAGLEWASKLAVACRCVQEGPRVRAWLDPVIGGQTEGGSCPPFPDTPGGRRLDWASVRDIPERTANREVLQRVQSPKLPVCSLTGTYPIWYI
jgi:hypothetical protein